MSGDLKQWYPAAELATMKLPGVPTSSPGVKLRAEKNRWSSRQVSCRGGKGGMRTEYQPPKPIMDIIRARMLASMVQATAPTERPEVPVKNTGSAVSKPSIPKPAELKDWQRQIAGARLSICAEVRRLAAVGGTSKAVQTVIDLAASGDLPEQLQPLVPIANARAGKSGGRALSRSSIYRWLKDASDGIGALAPKLRETATIPAWAPHLLALYRQPQKPALKWVLEQLPASLPAGIAPPSYFAARRFLDKISRTEVQRGRMGSREIKSIRPFVRRATGNLWPTDVYTADGHTFDAEVAHPLHGRAFRPEITTVLDIATRRVVGWSAGLAESTWAVLDALRHACLTGGIPAIFYVDNGSGYKNAAMSAEATGFIDRIGSTLTHSLPYNSQARGIEERSHQSIWVRGAKTLPTYMGADMDREARQKAYKITRADLRLVGSSRLLMPWPDFVRWGQAQVDAYNDRPHRSLPKIRDAETGKMRHQTPNEAWAEAVTEGWRPVMVEAAEADDLFRPYREARTHRGEVRLFNNLYFHPELEHHHGETVRVGYDIHSADRVWVRDRQGRLICVAEFEANKRDYFPQSFVSRAAEKRAKGRIKRAEARIDEAEAELNPAQVIEHASAAVLPPMDLNQVEQPLEMAPREPERSPAAALVMPLPERPGVRPHFTSENQKYRWLMQNKGDWTAHDAGWLGKFVESDRYYEMRDRFVWEGLAWSGEDDRRMEDLLADERVATR